MKARTYSVLSLVSWAIFFIQIWGGLPSYWYFICWPISYAALHLTIKLYTNNTPEQKPGGRSDEPASVREHVWEGIAPLSWGGFLMILAHNLPPYWSQLSPLLAIFPLYFALKVSLARKSEEKTLDLASQADDNRSVQTPPG
jgi:hypothetical protein